MTIIPDETSVLDPHACLYVIEINKGRIKVGYTVQPATRLALHREMALAFGAQPGREWTSLPGTGTAKRETALIDFCAKQARGQHRREYFEGVSFGAAVRRGSELCRDDALLRAMAALPSRAPASVDEAAEWLQISTDRVRALLGVGALQWEEIAAGGPRRGVAPRSTRWGITVDQTKLGYPI